MATSTLANSPSNLPFDGRLIEDLTDLAPNPEQPKPPQPDPRFSITTPTDEERRERNAAMLNTIWALGESLPDKFKCAKCKWTGVFCFGRCPACGSLAIYNITPEDAPKPTLQTALGGFPDVNSYYADAAGR